MLLKKLRDSSKYKPVAFFAIFFKMWFRDLRVEQGGNGRAHSYNTY
jgi:hypothetical protein